MNFKVSSSALYIDCFLLNVQDGTITITASDSEKYFITSVPAIEQNENASFCLPAKTILDSIKELPEQPLSFDFNPENHKVEGTHSSGSFSVAAQDAAPYPMPKTVDEEGTSLHLPASILLNGINRCLFATANDEIRLVMNGIYFDIKPDHIIFAGTDGRKLVRNINRNVQSGLTSGFIIPKKVAAILRAVLNKDEEDIEIKFDADKAHQRILQPEQRPGQGGTEQQYPTHDGTGQRLFHPRRGVPGVRLYEHAHQHRLQLPVLA